VNLPGAELVNAKNLLSTPSLGITRDHRCEVVRDIKRLSTPSLGITGSRAFAFSLSSSSLSKDFQLPLSGSLLGMVNEPESTVFQLPLSGSPAEEVGHRSEESSGGIFGESFQLPLSGSLELWT
jgi:hypothetical protein